MDNYRFDRLSKNNLPLLVKLYKDCFHLKVNNSYLDKKYNTQAFGASFIGFLAIDKKTQETAGYYGVFPILCRKEGKNMLAAQSGDTMTHPKHQAKGLFTKLAILTYELAKSEGVRFVFGFPNKNSYPGFIKKLNWVHYGDINNYNLKTGSLPFDKLAKKISLFGNLYKKFIDMKLNKFLTEELIPNSIEFQNRNFGFVVHDHKFYDYKTYFKIYRVKIIGINCVLKIDGRLWLGDMEYCNREKYFEVIGALQLLAKSLGCSSIHISVYNGLYFDALLKEKYKMETSNPVGALNLFSDVDSNKFAYQAIDFDTY